jgi:integration host factor subunit alpha
MAPVGLMRELGSLAKFAGDDSLTGEQTEEPPSTMRRTLLVANDDAALNSPALTKADLSNLLFEQVGLNKREAKDLVDAFFDELNSALERGESLKLTGFGNFQLRDKVSRPGRNPKTGVAVQIPARRVVTFHASQKLKDMVDTLSSAGHVDKIPRS